MITYFFCATLSSRTTFLFPAKIVFFTFVYVKSNIQISLSKPK